MFGRIGHMLKNLAVQDQRHAYVAALTAAAASASQKPNFNIEVEINDLWIALTNIKDAGRTQPLSGALSGPGALLSGIGIQLDRTLGQLLQNVQSLPMSPGSSRNFPFR